VVSFDAPCSKCLELVGRTGRQRLQTLPTNIPFFARRLDTDSNLDAGPPSMFQDQWTRQEDAEQEQEAPRLGVEIPPDVVRDRAFGPAV
jgi:hypothetical protein